jgi:sulfur carrier protein
MPARPKPALDRPALRRIVMNGEPVETQARTLADLLDEAGYGDAKVATARNGLFIAAKLRAETPLEEADRIEIVAPRAGG